MRLFRFIERHNAEVSEVLTENQVTVYFRQLANR